MVALTSKCLHTAVTAAQKHPVGSEGSGHTEVPVEQVVQEKNHHFLPTGWTVGGGTWLREMLNF